MMGSFSNLLHDLKLKDFFLVFLVAICAIYSFCKIWRSEKGEKRTLFLIYTSSVVIIILFAYFLRLQIARSYAGYIKVLEISNFMFSLIELLVFSRFFYGTLPHFNNKSPFHLISGFIITTSVIFCYLVLSPVTSQTLIKASELLCVLELVSIMVLCLSYFFRMYKQDIVMDFSTSLFVVYLSAYCVLGIAFFSIAESLRYSWPQIYQVIYSVHHLSLGILCLSIPSNKSSVLVMQA